MTGVAVLIVEDEFLIGVLIEEALVAGGFEVKLAMNGQKAIAEIEADANRFRALVTDIRVGKGPDGWEAARRARELVPNMAVVYVSADSGPDSTVSATPLPSCGA